MSMSSGVIERLAEHLRASGLSHFASTFAIEYLKRELGKEGGDATMARAVTYLLAQLNHTSSSSSLSSFPPHQRGCPGLLAGLTSRPFWDTSLPVFEWVRRFESSVDGIRQEVLNLKQSNARVFQPYRSPTSSTSIDSSGTEAVDGGAWNVCYLALHGVDFGKNRAHFPLTMSLMDAIPNGHYQHCFFSALAPDTHITPHHGPTNRKLRCQLPIIVPDDAPSLVSSTSRLRVGEEWVGLEQGKMIIFDDSFEHEAMNRSSQPRIVLIFDIWHPDFTAAEVKLFEFIMKFEMRALEKSSSLSSLAAAPSSDTFFDVIQRGKSAAAVVPPEQVWGK